MTISHSAAFVFAAFALAWTGAQQIGFGERGLGVGMCVLAVVLLVVAIVCDGTRWRAPRVVR